MRKIQQPAITRDWKIYELDSNPLSEYEETLNKARALVHAVAIAEEGF